MYRAEVLDSKSKRVQEKKIIIMFAAIQLARKTVERQRRTMLNEY